MRRARDDSGGRALARLAGVAATVLVAGCAAHAKPLAGASARETTTASRLAPHERSPLTPQLVIAKARSATGIQRCYTRYLKHAGGRGRVLVSFTVDSNGHAQDSATAGVPSPLGDCITAEVARWRFPAPANGAESFALPLELRAN